MGSGYSVEGQISGEEKFGGLQIEIIPSYQRNLKMWVTAPKSGESDLSYPFDHKRLDEGSTPADIGLKPSDKLRAYPFPCTTTVPLKISDLAEKFLYDKICLSVISLSRRRRCAISSSGFSKRLCFRPEIQPRGDFGDEMKLYGNDCAVKVRSAPEVTNQVETRNLRAMGLAAGGKMVQDIVRDNNAAAIWNLQNAKLMNIHILDPASC